MPSKKEPGRIAREIKRLMAERGMSALELAKRSGVKPTTLYSILDGQAGEPRGDTIAALADGLGVPVEALFGESKGVRRADEIIAWFRATPEAATMDPPFDDEDAARLRTDGRYTWTRRKPTARAILLLTRSLRLNAGIDDRSG